jgi:hypothetical protein
VTAGLCVAGFLLPLTAYQASKTQHAVRLLQVYFSRDCADSLVGLSDGHLRAQVLRQLHRLAKGAWPPILRPHNAVAPRYQSILQVHTVVGMYLVWMVDVDQSTSTQVGAVSGLLAV